MQGPNLYGIMGQTAGKVRLANATHPSVPHTKHRPCAIAAARAEVHEGHEDLRAPVGQHHIVHQVIRALTCLTSEILTCRDSSGIPSVMVRSFLSCTFWTWRQTTKSQWQQSTEVLSDLKNVFKFFSSFSNSVMIFFIFIFSIKLSETSISKPAKPSP